LWLAGSAFAFAAAVLFTALRTAVCAVASASIARGLAFIQAGFDALDGGECFRAGLGLASALGSLTAALTGTLRPVAITAVRFVLLSFRLRLRLWFCPAAELFLLECMDGVDFANAGLGWRVFGLEATTAAAGARFTSPATNFNRVPGKLPPL